MPVLHATRNNKPNSKDSTITRPQEWNEPHTVSVDLATEIEGILPIENGGTNADTANDALNNLLPSQTGNADKVLQTDGSDASWTSLSGAPVSKQTFTSATSVTVTHNLGYETLYQVFTSVDEIGAYTVTQTVNAITITFSSARSGYVVYVTDASYAAQSKSVNSVSTTYTIVTTDDTVITTGSSSYTVTLPTAVGVSGKIYNIKHTGSGTLTVATTSSQTIDGETTIIILAGSSGAYPNLQVQSDGSNWIIL